MMRNPPAKIMVVWKPTYARVVVGLPGLENVASTTTKTNGWGNFSQKSMTAKHGKTDPKN